MQKQQKQRNKLDLHGKRHSEVFDLVDVFISNHLYDTEVEIVTGYSQRMKDIVQEVLSDYNLVGVQPPFNDGTLIVRLI